MKESYKYEEGKIKIIDYDQDDNRKIIEKEYQDNIEDILDMENEIEYIEFNKEEVINGINYCDKKLNKLNINKRKTALKCLIIPNLISYIINYINIDFSFNVFNKIIESGYNEKDILIIIFSSTLVCYGIKMFGYKLDEKSIKNEMKSLNINKETLDKMLEKRRNKLKALNETKEKNNKKSNDNKYINIDYKEKLKELREELILYVDIANNYDEFLKYYNDNCLEKYLSDEYKKEEIEVIKKYYKERIKRK